MVASSSSSTPLRASTSLSQAPVPASPSTSASSPRTRSHANGKQASDETSFPTSGTRSNGIERSGSASASTSQSVDPQLPPATMTSQPSHLKTQISSLSSSASHLNDSTSRSASTLATPELESHAFRSEGTPFAPASRPPQASLKFLEKRRAKPSLAPNPPSVPTSPPPFIHGQRKATKPHTTSSGVYKGGRKRTKPDTEHVHSLTGPKLEDGQGLKRKRVVADKYKETRRRILAAIKKPVFEVEQEAELEVDPGMKERLLSSVEQELEQIKSEYKGLSDELVKAQIEESVWRNVKKETHTERIHLRHLNKGEMAALMRGRSG